MIQVVKGKVLGAVNSQAVPSAEVNNPRGGTMEKALMVHRTAFVPSGHRVKY